MLTQQGSCGLLQGTLNHVRLTVAVLLAALLALLWHSGHGPGAAAACCTTAVATTEPAAVATESAAVGIAAPNAQVLQNTSNLPPWTGPNYAVSDHEVQVPAARPPEAAPAPVELPAPAEEAVEPPAEPAYTLTDPNAEVRPETVKLPEWKGPSYPALAHFVYYPPAVAPVAEPAAPSVDEPPPAARVYFATSKWVLPKDIDAILAPVLTYLKSHPTAKAIIRGFHDPRGDADSNAVLAKNRAGAIWDALIAAGIEQGRIDLRKPENTVGSGTLAEARRAEVSVVP